MSSELEARKIAYDLFTEDATGAFIWVETVIGLDDVKKRVVELTISDPSRKYLVYQPTKAKFIEPFAKSA